METDSNILLVDDDPGMIRVLARILSGVATLRFATSGQAALTQAATHPLDLVLLDAEMPGMSGYKVCEAMKADPALRDVPIIFVTANSGVEFELRGLDIGAADFIAKPISEPLLLARVQTQLRIKRLNDELRRTAATDALTEVVNRRSFDEALVREWRRGLRDADALSLLMVDVDHFKLYNDRYGHPSGDACLRSVAKALRSACMRPADLVARYGGEEFAILLPQTPRAGAELMARRVLSSVESLMVPHEASPTAAHVTVSVGIGTFDEQSACWVSPAAARVFGRPEPRDPGHLLECADQALYAAKRAGRGRAFLLDIDDVSSEERAHESFGSIPAQGAAQ